MSLARAEIYLRRGDWQLSETLAVSSARALASTDLAAEAHLCAGTAALLLEDGNSAYDYYARALKHNDSVETRRKALWGQFMASFLANRTPNGGALEALEEARDTAPELRIHQARLHVASREGNMSEVVAEALAAEPLLAHIDDPLVRSGFLNILADQLSVTARYREAERIAICEIAESERFHLDFVLPFGLVNLAAAKLGLGAYTVAAALLDRSEREDRMKDEFLQVKRAVTRARINLSRGDARSALEVMEELTLGGVRTDVTGEAIATSAFAYACLSNERRAMSELERAVPLASDITSQVFIASTNALLAMDADDESFGDHVNEFARTVHATGNFDGAICAFRADARFLRIADRHSAVEGVVRIAAERSGDASLASALGETAIGRRRTRGVLSDREREVLDLVSQGFQNAEIGHRLFISPKTVKTHLQNIYEKLNVSSRTEAAVKAKESGLLG
jgi:ATP/maltotriose-dependent transcriptional regulator MalT